MQSRLLSTLDHLASYIGNTPLMPIVNAYSKTDVQFHAELIYVSSELTGDEVHQYAKDTYAANREQYFYANQYDNPHNWQAHYHTTA